MSMNEQGASVERLYKEIETAGTVNDGGAGSSAELVGEITAQLPSDWSSGVDEALVKESLDEVLLVLVALRDEGAHGKGLMQDLTTVFDARLSPGTVYPRLHELEEEGLLEMQELVRTKEYRIADSEGVRERIEDAMCQHFALGSVLENSTERL